MMAQQCSPCLRNLLFCLYRWQVLFNEPCMCDWILSRPGEHLLCWSGCCSQESFCISSQLENFGCLEPFNLHHLQTRLKQGSLSSNKLNMLQEIFNNILIIVTQSLVIRAVCLFSFLVEQEAWLAGLRKSFFELAERNGNRTESFSFQNVTDFHYE